MAGPRSADRTSPLDDDDFGHVEDDDGDTTTEDDLCAKCGDPRGVHGVIDGCPFYEVSDG